MIESIILQHLTDSLPGVSCHMEEPDDNESEYIVIEKTGSSEENHIYSATFAIMSYSTSLFNAASLNERVKAAMRNVITINSVSRSALNTDYAYPNTDKHKYRYQAVFDLTYMED